MEKMIPWSECVLAKYLSDRIRFIAFRCVSLRDLDFDRTSLFLCIYGVYRGEIEVRPAGIEPTTYGLEIRCSIRLSYGRFASGFRLRFICKTLPPE